MKLHQKHTKLIRPDGGKFHRNEWAIIGAACDVIKSLASDINEVLKAKFKVGFADEIHQIVEDQQPAYHSSYVNNLTHFSYNQHSGFQPFSYTSFFRSCDLVLVNGNHFTAQKQIVLINQKKKDSLYRKLDRLSDVRLFILDEGEINLHEFLSDHAPYDVPVFKIDEIDKIAKFLEENTKASLPVMDGLVLMGGKSSRMGQDKTKIEYHGLPQFQYAKNLLAEFTRAVYVSGNETAEYEDENELIRDTFIGLGPYGGILSAFRQDPARAILTLPADAPLADQELIAHLVMNRDPNKTATCYHNPETNFPEPLITIWEPKAYPILLQYLALGYSCPRKALINEDVLELKCPDPIKLKNANTPEEKAEMLSLIEKKN